MEYDERIALCRKVMNSGSWQHTWHTDPGDPNNYPKILEIAKEKRDIAIERLCDAQSLIVEMELYAKKMNEPPEEQ